MKINHKVLILSLLAVCLFSGLLLFTLEKTDKTNIIKLPTKSNPSTPTSAELEKEAEQNAEQKKAFIESSDASSSSADQNISVKARQEPDSSVTVLTQLNGYSSGTCKLTIVNGSRSLTQGAQIIYQPSFSTCAGFTVPSSQLGVGNWDITIDVTSDGRTATENIRFEVN